MVLVALAILRRCKPNYPSRQITLIVPFPPGGSTDVRRALLPNIWRPQLGQPVIIRNASVELVAVSRVGVSRRARRPMDTRFDIRQWDTHVGSIIYKLDYDLQKDFEPTLYQTTRS